MGEKIFQEDPKQKDYWLRAARVRFPLHARVCVRSSDLTAHVGRVGRVAGYDVGPSGSWPMITVAFDVSVPGAPNRDGFYGDGCSDDEIVSLSCWRTVRYWLARRIEGV